MGILHVKSITIADGTNSDIVRPSDYNSAHNMVLNVSGNTAGTSQISGQDIVWAGGNNVTLSLNGATASIHAQAQTVQTQASGNIAGTGYTSTTQAGSTVGATHNTAGLSMAWPPFLTTAAAAQTVQTQASGNIAGAGFTTTTVAGAVVAATHNSVGILMAVPNYLTTAQAPGAYLTTARASNDAIGLNTALTANGVSVTANSSGLSMNFPAFLTTAAQSNHSHNFATTTTGGAVIIVGTTNSAGATIGVPPFITTYVNDLTSGRAGVGTTFAGTNASASMTMDTAGLNFALSVAAGGGTINQTGPNIAVAGSTVTSGDVYFSNSPTVTFGMAGSTVTASAAGGGGGAATLGGWELWPPLGGNTAFSTGGLGTIYFQKFIAPANISFNNFERRLSGSTVSSAISAQAAHSITYGLYSHGTGASTSIYNLIASSSMFMQASYSSNLSAGHTISQGAGSYTASSAGTVGQGALTGFKHVYFPFTSTITAGGEYAVAMVMSSATTGATGPLRLGMLELSVINNLTIGKIYASTVLATAASFVGDFAQGVYSSSSNGLPATLAISGLTNAVSQQRMYLQFEA